MDEPVEIWREVPGYPGFMASSRGRVMGKRGRILTAKPDRYGYLWAVWQREPRRIVSYHALVALAFIGPRPEGYDLDHIDRCRDNNAPDNLRYCTHAENMATIVQPRAGSGAKAARTAARLARPTKEPRPPREPRVRQPQAAYVHRGPARLTGQANGRAMLTEDQARSILALPRPSGRSANGAVHPHSLKALAARFGVGKVTIADLLAGRTWRHLHERETTEQKPNPTTKGGA